MPISQDTIVTTLIRNRSRFIGYAWVVAGNPQLAEDIIQDVTRAAIKKADQIQDEQHLHAWLKRSIRLRGLELRRNQLGKARLLSPEVLDLLEQASLARHDESESDRMEALRHCAEQLTDRAKETLAMRYGEDIKPAEIADRSGRPIKSVYQMITRAHTTLRKCIGARLNAEGGAA